MGPNFVGLNVETVYSSAKLPVNDSNAVYLETIVTGGKTLKKRQISCGSTIYLRVVNPCLPKFLVRVQVYKGWIVILLDWLIR